MDLVVDKGNDKPFWIKYIHQRISQNKNFLGIISGPTGSGKSWSGLSIGEQVDKDFNADRIIFKGTELLKLINSGNLKKGSCIIWDEAGVDLSNRAWQSATNKLLNFLLQTFRHRNFVLLFTTPYSDFVDKLTRRLFHAEFKTVGIDFENSKCKLKPQLIQYNSRYGKFYYKYLRVVSKKDGVLPIIEWNVNAPSKELVDAYEKKKNEFTSSLNKDIETELLQLEQTKKDKLQPKETKEPIKEEVKVKEILPRRPLTDLQEKVMKVLAYYEVKDAVKVLNMNMNTIYFHRKHALNKGYTFEEFKTDDKKEKNNLK